MSETNDLLAWDAPRPCDYCEKSFKPKRPQDRKQHFCCDDHRKRFFEYGARMQIVAAITRLVRQDIERLQKRVAQLERQVKNPAWSVPSAAEVRKRIRAGGIDKTEGRSLTLNTEVMDEDRNFSEGSSGGAGTSSRSISKHASRDS